MATVRSSVVLLFIAIIGVSSAFSTEQQALKRLFPSSHHVGQVHQFSGRHRHESPRSVLSRGPRPCALMMAMSMDRGLSSSSPPKGCAAKPFEKKKIAVFGAGGYIGATAFGFLQRASSLYGTGIAGGSSPRAIGSTRTTSEALNRVLSSSFQLAYAGEDLVRLIDIADASHISDRLRNFDAVILGTSYQLERRAVTPNTYERTPNDKTYDFYLDGRYGAKQEEPTDKHFHCRLFENAIRACNDNSSTVKHLVILETSTTKQPQKFMDILLDKSINTIPYTYIRTKSPLKKDVSYTFQKGFKDSIDITSVKNLDTNQSTIVNNDDDTSMAIYREDIAALMVQSLLSFQWEQSRILELKAKAKPTLMDLSSSSSKTGDVIDSGYAYGDDGRRYYRAKNKQNMLASLDKEWCKNSKLMIPQLSSII